MLTFAADFWPLFWAITGAGALLAVVLTAFAALIAGDRQPALVPVPVELPAQRPAGRDQHAQAA